MLIAGVDEAGRGALCGEVVAAAVILDQNHFIEGLNDSKKLTAKKREVLYEQICRYALSWSVGFATVLEIDQINILEASMLAMKRAVEGLQIRPQKVLVDGNKCPDFGLESEAIIGGDGLVDCISAASIIAKVSRDRAMLELDQKYPQYKIAQHKGYGTKLHLQALGEFGASEIHRRSFAPVKNCLQKGLF